MHSDGDPALLDEDVRSGAQLVRKHRDLLQQMHPDWTIEAALEEAIKHLPDDPEHKERVREAIRIQASTSAVKLARIPLNRESEWPAEHSTVGGHHWTALRDFLRDEVGRTDAELNNLDGASDGVLRDLGYPLNKKGFDIRGLAVGYVQSGKTQNFTAVIAKALDAGYRIVVVLAGMTDSLRNQTQRRLMGELGAKDFPYECVELSGDSNDQVVWLTKLDTEDKTGDFEPGSQELALGSGAKFVAVVKKNGSRLEKLIESFQGNIPDNTALLVIDDECDQASVDTGDFEPTTINMLVRSLVESAKRVSYVGYTATPQANHMADAKDSTSLFPRDFMSLLPPPVPPPDGRYTGAAELFGENRIVEQSSWFRRVTAAEAQSVDRVELGAHKALRKALWSFFLASACRIHRAGTEDVPCIMMVHTSPYTNRHESVRKKLSELAEELRVQWETRRESAEEEFRKLWDDDFRRWWNEYPHSSAPPELDDVLLLLDRVIQGFRGSHGLQLINSDEDGVNLDFDRTPNLKAVIIGGNKLSRGLTIPGLLISYFTRSSTAQDTFAQMERWFGYRGDYIDLTRIYTTDGIRKELLIAAQLDEEMRHQILQQSLNSDNKPDDVAQILAISPRSRLTPTSKTKMRGATQHRLSWAGMGPVVARLPFNRGEHNLEVTRALLNGLGAPVRTLGRVLPENPEIRPCWHLDTSEPIRRFIEEFEIDNRDFVKNLFVDYIVRQNEEGELNSWFVVVAGVRESENDHPSLDLSIADGRPIHPVDRTRRDEDHERLGAIWGGSHGDHERWGLTEEQLKLADKRYAEYAGHLTRAQSYRSVRDPREGLMVIYPVSRYSGGDPPVSQDPENDVDLVAPAFSFPDSTSKANRDVVSHDDPHSA